MIICHFETKEIHVMWQDATFQGLDSTLVQYIATMPGPGNLH